MPTGHPTKTLTSSVAAQLKQQLADIHERLAVESKRERQRARLRTFLRKLDLLGSKDIYKIVAEVVTKRRGDGPVISDKTNKVGAAIRVAREKAGLSQSQLADKAGGVSHGAISEYETGKKRPQTTTLRKLSKALGGLPKSVMTNGTAAKS